LGLFSNLTLGNTILYGVFLVFGVGSLLFAVINSGLYWYKSGDSKPLVENTLGRIVASDKSMVDILVEMEKSATNIPYRTFLLQELIKDFIIVLVFVYLLYLLIKKIFHARVGEQQVGWLDRMIYFALAVFLIGVFELIYVKAYLGLWIIPYSGFYKTIFSLFGYAYPLVGNVA